MSKLSTYFPLSLCFLSSMKLNLFFHPSYRHGVDQPAEEDYFFNWADGVPKFVHLDGDIS